MNLQFSEWGINEVWILGLLSLYICTLFLSLFITATIEGLPSQSTPQAPGCPLALVGPILPPPSLSWLSGVYVP